MEKRCSECWTPFLTTHSRLQDVLAGVRVGAEEAREAAEVRRARWCRHELTGASVCARGLFDAR
jgi:hypothetical protein